MKKFLTLFIVSAQLVLAGCEAHLMNEPETASADIWLNVVPSEAKGDGLLSRSSYDPGDMDRITDFTIFVFDKSGHFVSSGYYRGDEKMSGRTLFVNETLNTTLAGTFEVFVIANLGNLSSSSALCDGGIPASSKITGFSYSFSDSFGEFSSKGFPISGVPSKASPFL